MLCINRKLVVADSTPFDIDPSTAPACRQLINDYAGENAATAFDDLIAKAWAPDAIFGTGLGAELSYDVRKAAFVLNKHLLATGLAKYSVGSAEAEYEGSGDSGGIERVICSNPELLKLDAAVFEARVHRNAQGLCCQVNVHNAEFADAMSDLTDEAITLTDHDGFWNNDGGRGTFTLLADGTAKLEHIDYMTVEDASDHDL